MCQSHVFWIRVSSICIIFPFFFLHFFILINEHLFYQLHFGWWTKRFILVKIYFIFHFFHEFPAPEPHYWNYKLNVYFESNVENFYFTFAYQSQLVNVNSPEALDRKKTQFAWLTILMTLISSFNLNAYWYTLEKKSNEKKNFIWIRHVLFSLESIRLLGQRILTFEMNFCFSNYPITMRLRTSRRQILVRNSRFVRVFFWFFFFVLVFLSLWCDDAFFGNNNSNCETSHVDEWTETSNETR